MIVANHILESEGSFDSSFSAHLDVFAIKINSIHSDAGWLQYNVNELYQSVSVTLFVLFLV